MIASYFGGFSLTYSEVGVCHALSYGLGKVLDMKHGFANCIAFNQLPEIYGEYVNEFKEMVVFNKVELPLNLSSAWSEETLDAMADVAWNLPHMWNHAFGPDWQTKMSREKIKAWYKKM
jgi:3-deoxy-alpha-D-manno-octulosonate 8-oxidase